jgi:hypothetical protein
MADAIYTKVAEFMTDSVVFTPRASVDKYNKPTFGGEWHKCHRYWSPYL